MRRTGLAKPSPTVRWRYCCSPTRGLSNRQIAASLNLSEATISRHLANIYGRMDVSSRSEAAKIAMSRGWISLPDIIG